VVPGTSLVANLITPPLVTVAFADASVESRRAELLLGQVSSARPLHGGRGSDADEHGVTDAASIATSWAERAVTEACERAEAWYRDLPRFPNRVKVNLGRRLSVGAGRLTTLTRTARDHISGLVTSFLAHRRHPE
jgi:hypothetical protein